MEPPLPVKDRAYWHDVKELVTLAEMACDKSNATPETAVWWLSMAVRYQTQALMVIVEAEGVEI